MLNREKKIFIGISLAPLESNDTGIAVLDENCCLLRIDRVYTLEDFQIILKNTIKKDNCVIAIDLPKNIKIVSGKWRITSRVIDSFRGKRQDYDWRNRYSTRGKDIIEKLVNEGYEVIRYNSSYVKNILNLNEPYKSRTQEGCKMLQMAISKKLNIKNVPHNIISTAGLDAILGAYTAYKYEEKNFNLLGKYENLIFVCPK